jgi:alcohol dehydrogenase class IV
MKEFNYYQPTEIRFGQGRLEELGEAVGRYGINCLLVTVPEIPEFSGLFRRAKKILKDKGINVVHFDGVIPNPTVEVVAKGANLAKYNQVEVVVGLGGGSTMDTAKAIAVEATHPGNCWDYIFSSESQPTEKTLPIIAVPTTSGTGSHVTQVAVVTNSEEKYKSALFNNNLYPRISIVDPELVVTLPPYFTATTGFDVFAHAFESYINPNGSPYTDMTALESIRIVARYLPPAVREGKNIEARSWMAWADTLAGLSIANAGVTLPHGIAMALGGHFPHVAHGEALAAVYSAIMRFTYKASPQKFATVARIFDPSLEGISDELAAERACEIIDNFLQKIDLKIGLKDLKIPEAALKELAEASFILPDYKSHPRKVNVEEVYELLRQSYNAVRSNGY